LLKSLASAVRRGAEILQHRRSSTVLQAQRRRVAEILTINQPPNCSAAEQAFEALQMRYCGVGEYGYDAYSTWSRGVQRADALIRLLDRLKSPGAQILETACGDGMTGFALSSFGHKVILTDLEDWRDVRAQGMRFDAADICEALPMQEGKFVICVTYNSFEHFPNPRVALKEMVRVLEPGGWLFAEFGPLFAGPWGLHAYRTLRMPFPQFLFSETFWRGKLKELGMRDLNRVMDGLQPMNQWTARQFRELWECSGCEVLQYSEGEAESHLDLIEAFPSSFQGRGLTLQDVTTHSIQVLLRKRYSQ
jgi:ubiquinone/menaquinone biosynthesis C-methylase UbiE